MNNLQNAHDALDNALDNIDKACNSLIAHAGEKQKENVKKLGIVIGEILFTQKKIRDEDPSIIKNWDKK